jgi:ATP-dependent metalloprotease FtsH
MKKTLRKWILLSPLLLALPLYTLLKGPAEQQVSYPRFITQLESHALDTVTIQFLSYGQWQVSYDVGDTHYTVYVPESLSGEVIQKLREQKVDFTPQQHYGDGLLQRYFLVAINLLMIGVLVYSTRRMRSTEGKYNKRVQRSTARFADIGGLDEVIEDIGSITELLKRPQAFKAIGGRPPKGVLLYGPPGTGKTLIARAIAGEAGVSMLYVSGSEFEDTYVGVGAARARKLYRLAKKHAPCVVFIDEIDAVGTTRNSKNGEQTINQLLSVMDGFDGLEGVLTLAATNRLELLDSALTRPGRFDRKIHVPLPAQDSRADILKRILKRRQIQAEALDLNLMAAMTRGMSGAELENLLNTALEHVHREQRQQLTMRDVDHAVEQILIGPAALHKVGTEALATVACHEAGHTLAAYHLSARTRSQIYCTSIIPREGHLGRLVRVADEDPLPRMAHLQEELVILLAGRAAEYVHYKDFAQVSVGAAEDLKQATQLAERMVTELGYEEKPHLQRSYTHTDRATRQHIEDQKDQLLKAGWEQALALIQTHNAELEMLSKALLAEKKVYATELGTLLG